MDAWLFCFLIAGLPCCIGCIVALLLKFCYPTDNNSDSNTEIVSQPNITTSYQLDYQQPKEHRVDVYGSYLTPIKEYDL